ncbi:MAG: septum formation initiator family protein [Emcibacter sp.]|nr:septum formation initiator family protein [Emcibacter sp.]
MNIQNRFRKMAIPMACSLLIGYFFIFGMRSMQTKISLNNEISVLEQEYSLIHERRLGIESHVELLQPGHVNPDFLDEKSREILGLIHKDEIVIRHKN